MDYYINRGDFSVQDDTFTFNGKSEEITSEMGDQVSTIPSYGEVFLPGMFHEGTITMNIVFSEICQDARMGIILNLKNVNSVRRFYQVCVSNKQGLYSVDYYDGENWHFNILGGGAHFQPNVEYCIKIKLNGNLLALYLNNVRVAEFSKYINNFAGICGFFISNTDKATIRFKANSECPTAFCIMKFEKDFDELYNDVIKPVLNQCGFDATRADEFNNPSPILQDIIRGIEKSSVVICDVTIDNPNVFYELGYAHALNKPTILLADGDKRDRLPFDISGYRTIFYSNSIAGKRDVESRLSNFITNIVNDD